MARWCCATATGWRWERSSSVSGPSDDAATYWRVSETVLSYRLGTRVVGAFGLLNSYCLKTLSNARITPVAHIGRERGVGLLWPPIEYGCASVSSTSASLSACSPSYW